MNLRELSTLLGLSQTTVSRALNGYPEVKEATRLRVTAAADKHGYHPNTRARSLATGRAMTIGHVIPVSTKHEMLNPVFADFIAGAGEAYAEAGYDMILSLTPDDQQAGVYRKFAQKKSVDGIILHGPRMGDKRIDMLADLGLPFVVHGRVSDAAKPYAWVDVNNRRAFARAADFLIDLGHQRIALINGLEDMDFALRRREGFETALTARGLTPLPHLMASSEMTEIKGHAAAAAMLGGPNPPTAILTSSLISALGVRRAIEERGLTMGREVSVITHDDVLGYLPNGADVPIYTATKSSVRAAGQTAAKMLLDQINAPQSPLPTKLLEAELTVGQSTGPAPK
ncbi:substrate-binding domain-containing protein [Alphaproteobacteria bacterium KMM 3653]|uniref:Substrate-binding domain-containing protein n=1 Tax=Harenicola maris TaxID=2841044 RepID=A0AAP2CN76_9RHOB|nr:substrate-binding domain-containing protein [Harenicola maris]